MSSGSGVFAMVKRALVSSSYTKIMPSYGPRSSRVAEPFDPFRVLVGDRDEQALVGERELRLGEPFERRLRRARVGERGRDTGSRFGLGLHAVDGVAQDERAEHATGTRRRS